MFGNCAIGRVAIVTAPTLADLHRAHCDSAILPHDGNQIATLLLSHGSLRDQHGIRLHSRHGTDPAVLAGTKYVAGIRKQSGQLARI